MSDTGDTPGDGVAVDGDELDRMLDEFADSGALVKVYRRPPRPGDRRAFLFDFPPDEPPAGGSIERYLRDHYGGGSYLLQIRVGGKIRKSPTIDVEPPRDPVLDRVAQQQHEPEDTAPAPPPAVDPHETGILMDLVRSLLEGQREISVELAKVAGGSGGGSGSLKEIVGMWTALQELRPREEDPIDRMMRYAEFFRTMNAGRGGAETNTNDLALEAVRAFGPMFQRAMTAPAPAPAPVPGQTPPTIQQPALSGAGDGTTAPGDDGAAAPGGDGETENGSDGNPQQLQQLLGELGAQLIRAAQRGADPALFADLLIDEIGEGPAIAYFGPGLALFSQMASQYDQLEPLRPWFQSLADALAEDGHDDDAHDAANGDVASDTLGGGGDPGHAQSDGADSTDELNPAAD